MSLHNPCPWIVPARRRSQAKEASLSPFRALFNFKKATEPSHRLTESGNRSRTIWSSRGLCIKAWEMSNDLKKRFSVAQRINIRCKDSQDGVGLEYPIFLALVPRARSLATMRHLTLIADLNAQTQRAPMTLADLLTFWTALASASLSRSPVWQASKLFTSSCMPSKPKLVSKDSNVWSSMMVSGFQTLTLPPPSLTVTLSCLVSGRNWIAETVSSLENSSGEVIRWNPFSSVSPRCCKGWHDIEQHHSGSWWTNKLSIIGSSRICFSKSETSTSAVRFRSSPTLDESMSPTGVGLPSPTSGMFVSPSTSTLVSNSCPWVGVPPSTGASTNLSGVDGECTSVEAPGEETDSGLFCASKAFRRRLHSALWRLPGASIPLSQAGQRLVFWKTLELSANETRWPFWESGDSTCFPIPPLKLDFGATPTGPDETCCLEDDPIGSLSKTCSSPSSGGFISSWGPDSAATIRFRSGDSPVWYKNSLHNSKSHFKGSTTRTFLAVNRTKVRTPSKRTFPCTTGPWEVPQCKKAASISLVSFGTLCFTESGNSAMTVVQNKEDVGLDSLLPHAFSRGLRSVPGVLLKWLWHSDRYVRAVWTGSCANLMSTPHFDMSALKIERLSFNLLTHLSAPPVDWCCCGLERRTAKENWDPDFVKSSPTAFSASVCIKTDVLVDEIPHCCKYWLIWE